MEVKFYTHSPIQKNLGKTLWSLRNIELLLLIFVAGIGILGSVFVFNSNGSSQTSKVSYSFIPAHTDLKSMNSDFVVLKTSQLTLTINKNQFLEETPLMLDMGDGNQILLTEDVTSYTYKNKGKYSLILTGQENNKIINTYNVQMVN